MTFNPDYIPYGPNNKSNDYYKKINHVRLAKVDSNRQEFFGTVGGESPAPVVGLPVTAGLIGRYDFGDAGTMTIVNDRVTQMLDAEGEPQTMVAFNDIGPKYDAVLGRSRVDADEYELNVVGFTVVNGNENSIFTVCQGVDLTDGGLVSTNGGLGTLTLVHIADAGLVGYMTLHQNSFGGHVSVAGTNELDFGPNVDFTKKAVYGFALGDLANDPCEVYSQGVHFSGTRQVGGSVPNGVAISKGRRGTTDQLWVYETIFYNRKLSKAECDQVVAWLTTKHGI